MNSKRSHKPRAAIKDEAVFVGATTTRRGYMSQVHSQLFEIASNEFPGLRHRRWDGSPPQSWC